MNRIKKIAGSLVLGTVLATSFTVASFAQDWRHHDQWEQRRERREERWEERRERERYARRHDGWNNGYNYDRRYDRWNNGYYTGGNSYYAQQEFQRGYRDGLDRGRQDAQTNRARTPNNSSHYRSGNQYYRQGFERGFYEAYNQYSNYRWGRRW